ncbi:hypothetical protein MOSE0_I04126 [Monosporozyma servazzii]
MSESEQDNIEYIERNHLKVPPHLDKPWFREAYSAAKRFHEKDKVLDARDRLDLCNTYKAITKAQTGAGWLGFISVFGTPFVYKYYTTATIRGVKVPKPFFLGMLGMLVSSHFASNFAYKKQLEKLDPDGTLGRKIESSEHDLLEDDTNHIKSRNERQYEMLTLLKNGGSPRWAAYFYMTYLHPNSTFPDPELKLKQLQDGKQKTSISPFMHQRDPMGLYTNKDTNYWKSPKKYLESKDEKPSSNDVGPNWSNPENSSSTEHQQSSWDKIRNNSNRESSLSKSQDAQNDDDWLDDFSCNTDD